MSDKKTCVIAMVVENRDENAPKVNTILGKYSDKILGRMGLPNQDKGVSLISVIMEANSDDIGAVTGKLGQIDGVKVKSVSV